MSLLSMQTLVVRGLIIATLIDIDWSKGQVLIDDDLKLYEINQMTCYHSDLLHTQSEKLSVSTQQSFNRGPFLQ